MRVAGFFISAVAAWVTTAAAQAALVHIPAFDQPFAIPGPNAQTPGLIDLAPQASYTHSVSVAPNATHQVIGFSFAGVATNIGGEPLWWASDTKLTITLLDHNNVVLGSHSVGGFWNVVNNWDFQGQPSSPNGLYIHGLNSPHGNGLADYAWKNNPLPQNVPIGQNWTWQFKFEQDSFNTHVIWKGVVINMHLIPSPGGLALLCTMFIIGRCRKRM